MVIIIAIKKSKVVLAVFFYPTLNITLKIYSVIGIQNGYPLNFAIGKAKHIIICHVNGDERRSARNNTEYS